MENWLFGICMLGVAIVISMIATFFKQIVRLLKRRKKEEPEWVTVMSAEYTDKDFWGRPFGKENEKMTLNSEQQELFDLGVELYEVYAREELNNPDPFFAEARIKFYKSVLALAINHVDLNEKEITKIDSLEDYEKLLSTLPNNHLARTYYQGIQNATPIIKLSMMGDFKSMMHRFNNIIEEALE
jgi:hypothetical protein